MTLIAVVLMHVLLVSPGEILTFINQHLLSRYDEPIDRRFVSEDYRDTVLVMKILNLDLRHTLSFSVFGRPFVKRFAQCYRTVVLSVLSVLSCLSVTLVYCGQTVGRIEMKLGTQIGLGPGHIVLDWDPAPLPQRRAKHPIFGPYLLRPNGCRDQDATWYGGRTTQATLC